MGTAKLAAVLLLHPTSGCQTDSLIFSRGIASGPRCAQRSRRLSQLFNAGLGYPPAAGKPPGRSCHIGGGSGGRCSLRALLSKLLGYLPSLPKMLIFFFF